MKQYIRRMMLWLYMAVCLVSLMACSANADVEGGQVDPQIQMAYCPAFEGMLEELSSYPEEEFDQMIEVYQSGMIDDKELANVMVSGITSFANVKKDLGELKTIISSELTIGEDGEYICTVNAEYEKRNMEFKVFFSLGAQGPALKSMSFSPEYILAENMSKAALNTLMGMGTVFIVLISLSFLISCFKYISVVEKKIRDRNVPPVPTPVATAPSEPAPAAVYVPSEPDMADGPEEDGLVDDLELVAVITAAIAAATESTGGSADGLVVRSIRRAPATRWKRA